MQRGSQTRSRLQPSHDVPGGLPAHGRGLRRQEPEPVSSRSGPRWPGHKFSHLGDQKRAGPTTTSWSEKAAPFSIDWEAGFDEQGRLLALEAPVAGRLRLLPGRPVGPVRPHGVPQRQRLPHLERSRSTATAAAHKPSNTAFRGPGGPPEHAGNQTNAWKRDRAHSEWTRSAVRLASLYGTQQPRHPRPTA